MKVKLTIENHGRPQLVISPENELESIALHAWFDKYHEGTNTNYRKKATLIIGTFRESK